MRVRVARKRERERKTVGFEARRRAAMAKDRRKERGMKARKRGRRESGRRVEEPRGAAGLKDERMGPCRKKWRKNDEGEEASRRDGGRGK